MKKIILFASVLMVSLLSFKNSNAQLNVNINIGSQPVWGPTGYDHVDYYYLPDIESYYYVPSGQYIYNNGGRWVWANNLPVQYRNFNLYSAYKVVINKPQPYLNNSVYAKQYSKYKNNGGRQTVIRDSRDSKYYAVKGHPNYNGNNNKQTVARPQNNPNRGNSANNNLTNARPANNNRAAVQQVKPAQQNNGRGNAKLNSNARPQGGNAQNERGGRG